MNQKNRGIDCHGHGRTAATLGPILHCAVAFTVATVFVVAARRMSNLTQHWVISWLVYGIVVFLVNEHDCYSLERDAQTPDALRRVDCATAHAPPGRWASYFRLLRING